jgi:hypothetical protein
MPWTSRDETLGLDVSLSLDDAGGYRKLCWPGEQVRYGYRTVRYCSMDTQESAEQG